MSCPFCTPSEYAPRAFYQDARWTAFLAAPYNTCGHTILALKPKCSVCPRVDVLGWGMLQCSGTSLAAVCGYLKKHYQPKDILVASVRGHIKHFHWHLLPLWEKEETFWREKTCYPKGHLMEFIGWLEERSCRREKEVRKGKDLDEDRRRAEITEKLQPDVRALRSLTGYCPA